MYTLLLSPDRRTVLWMISTTTRTKPNRLTRLRRQFVKSFKRCVYCGYPLSDRSGTLDHIVPTSRGGTNARQNLALACKHCNNCKASRTPEEWIADLEAARARFTRIVVPVKG